MYRLLFIGSCPGACRLRTHEPDGSLVPNKLHGVPAVATHQHDSCFSLMSNASQAL